MAKSPCYLDQLVLQSFMAIEKFMYDYYKEDMVGSSCPWNAVCFSTKKKVIRSIPFFCCWTYNIPIFSFNLLIWPQKQIVLNYSKITSSCMGPTEIFLVLLVFVRDVYQCSQGLEVSSDFLVLVFLKSRSWA